MFEIGDDLPTLGAAPERLSLVKNADLLDMARLGRAATPVDLLTYTPSDQQPSVFLLHEDGRQTMLTVFNWTEQSRTRTLNFAQLGLQDPAHYEIVDAFGDEACCDIASGGINLIQKPRSVRMLKLIDRSVPATPPAFDVRSPSAAAAGENSTFEAAAASSESPVLAYNWDFGDGTSGEGVKVRHAYTHSGEYRVTVTVTGLGSVTNRKTVTVAVSGEISTRFDPSQNQRVD